ncbi:MAG: ABC transporter permease [Christensenellales bacterium]|jgi:ribose transport system permease protein
MKRQGLLKLALLNNTPLILLVVLFIATGILEPKFFSWSNIENIFLSSSYIGVLAIGMTFVLLTGGIDLSVGSTMYMTAALTGLLISSWNTPTWLAVIIMLIVSAIIGLINGVLIAKLKLLPFLTTMAMMVLLRGIALVFTKSVLVKLPSSLSSMGSVKLLGLIPVPVVLLIIVIVAASTYLTRTAGGKQIYAVGNNAEGARLAGINQDRITIICYVVCGFLAGVSGLMAVTQYGVVNAGFGEGVEFNAIAAAVLGGVSLSGGVGRVFPGTLIGTILIQLVQIALVYLKVDLYITPIISALVIFFAVLLDSYRISIKAKIERRNICKIAE